MAGHKISTKWKYKMEYFFNYLSYKVGFYTIEFQNLSIFQKYIFKNFKIIFTILVAYLHKWPTWCGFHRLGYHRGLFA